MKCVRSWDDPSRPPRRLCEADDCHRGTREGKAYCSDHVLQQPYVLELVAEIEAKQEEEERVRRVGVRAVDPRGLTAQEILRFLYVNGSRTLPRLARDLNLSVEVLQSYVKVLKRKRAVQLGVTDRGVPIVELSESLEEAA